MKITIGSTSTVLALPRSATARMELIQAIGEDQRVSLRVAAAAVGLGWPRGAGRPRARFVGDVKRYGGEVADELLERGAMIADIVVAGASVIEATVADGIPGLLEVQEVADPIEAVAAGSP